MKIIFKKTFFLLLLALFISKQQRAITLTVGAGETYATIAAAYAAATTAASYTIEVYADYANTEAKPITLAGGIGFTSMVIRPYTGAGAISITTGAAAAVFDFTGGDNITIDGRIGSTGSTILWTISNTQTAASTYAIRFSGGSTGNTIRYCNVLGSNSTVASAATTAGVVLLSSGTNSNNTFDYCTIKDASGGKPAVGINSYDATNNNQTTVSNCNIANFTAYGLMISTSQTAWSITGNSFYADYSITGAQAIYMIHITTGTGYTITGNYFGGQATQGGSAGTNYTLSSAYQFYPIYFASCTAGTMTINGNTIKNIAFTCTYAGLQFAAIYVAAGSADFNFGITSSHNVIGTGTSASITITDNVNSASVVQCFLGKFLNTGTNTISYNDVGWITINGSNTNAGKTTCALYIDKGTENVTYNTIGNTTANNIVLSPTTGAITYLIYALSTCLGTTTISNNTVQNVQNNAATGNFKVLYALNQLTCDGNTFSGISSASSYNGLPAQNIINFGTTETVAITNNVIKGITFSDASSEVAIVWINNTAATINFSNNTIGQFGVANDITIAGNDVSVGVYFYNCGAITCASNILQNFNATSSGTNNAIVGIYANSACDGTNTFTDNGIDNFTSAGTPTNAVTGNIYAIAGIYFSGDGTNTFTNNTITDLTLSSTTATSDLYVIGINFPTATGTITVNKTRITGLIHKGTKGATVKIDGILSTNDGAANYFYNNVIILDNDVNTNWMPIYGLDMTCTGTGTFNFYQNTVKIAGSTSGTALSYAFYTTNASASTFNVKNNIFQNKRTTSGSGLQYAIGRSSTTPTWTETNNYLETSTADIGNWGGTNKTDLTNWQGVSGASDKTGTITLATSGVCAAATVSDVKATGADLNGISGCDFDIDATARPDAPYMGAYENTVALPIELINFTATPVAKLVEVRWTTVTEINNDYFTIERSANAIDFTPVAKVKGAGNSNSIINYVNSDIQPLKGISYYRLKQTDYDGNYTYSEIITVNFAEQGELKVFPNPTTNALTLSFLSTADANCILNVYDSKGSFVKSSAYMATQDGINNIDVNLSELPEGMYFITLFHASEVLKATVVKE